MENILTIMNIYAILNKKLRKEELGMNKITYGIMTLIFNSIGVPCFIQGKVKAGVIRIILGCVTFGIVSLINEIIGIINGIKILCMSDEEYEAKKETLLFGIPSGL